MSEEVSHAQPRNPFQMTSTQARAPIAFYAMTTFE